MLPIIMLIVTFILFFLMLQIPAEQRAQVYLPSLNPHLTPEQLQETIQETIERYGLDKPFPVQYVNWLGNLIKGQWGWSPSWKQPVLEGILQRAPASVELAIFAMIPSIALALAVGSLASRYHKRIPDHIIRAAAFVGWAFPPFIFGLMSMNVLYAWLKWFPPERLSVWAKAVVTEGGFRTYTGLYTVDAILNGDLRIFWDAVRHMVLPGLTLALTQWALLTRIVRSSLLDALRQDYITTARAKGVHERTIVSLHARRNAVLPVISIGGAATSVLITGIAIVEIIFNYRGLGRAAMEAIWLTDIPAVVGFSIFSCLVIVVVSLITDILYAFIDPRVRLY
jgi:peptide/nickel transport system permease protein